MRTVVRALAITALLFVNGSVQGTDYYLNPRGDDRNEGTGIDHAWTSIARLNQAILMPGDRVFFEAGARYRGSLLLEPEDRGTDTDPITITSYGDGRARIDAGEGGGVFAHNTAGIVLSHIAIIGDGYPRNTSDGVVFLNDLSGDVLLGGLPCTRLRSVDSGKTALPSEAGTAVAGSRTSTSRVAPINLRRFLEKAWVHESVTIRRRSKHLPCP